MFVPLALISLIPAFAGGSPWAGSFSLQGPTVNRFNGGALTLAPAGGDAFDFSLSMVSGAHMGEINGRAKVTGDRAFFREDEYGCELRFALVKGVIELSANPECSAWGGVGIVFEGSFHAGPPPNQKPASLVDQGVLASPAQEKAFWAMVGPGGSRFVDLFQLASDEVDLDGLGAAVRSGAPRGLFTVQEGVIMATPDGKLWAAVIDPSDGQVYYYTNQPEWRARLPKTIESWRSRFPEKKVVFSSH